MTSRLNFSYFYLGTMLPMLDEVIKDGYEEEPEVWTQLFKQKTMTGSIKSSAGRSGFGLAQDITEGGDIPTDDRVQLFKKQWIPRIFGIGTETTREVVDDDQLDIIADDGRELGRSVRVTCEIAAANVFANGFDPLFPGPDGKPLFALDHPLVKAGISQPNMLSVAADLDVPSLEIALTDYRTMKSDNGFHMSNPTPNLVISPHNLWNATEINASKMRSDTANNAVNAIKTVGALESIIEWKYLIDPDAWFLVASPGRTGLIWYWRKRPYRVDDLDKRSERAFRGIKYREDHGFEHYRGCYGTPGV